MGTWDAAAFGVILGFVGSLPFFALGLVLVVVPLRTPRLAKRLWSGEGVAKATAEITQAMEIRGKGARRFVCYRFVGERDDGKRFKVSVYNPGLTEDFLKSLSVGQNKDVMYLQENPAQAMLTDMVNGVVNSEQSCNFCGSLLALILAWPGLCCLFGGVCRGSDSYDAAGKCLGNRDTAIALMMIVDAIALIVVSALFALDILNGRSCACGFCGSIRVDIEEIETKSDY